MKIIVDKLPETKEECPFLHRFHFGDGRNMLNTENRCSITMRNCTRFYTPTHDEEVDGKDTNPEHYGRDDYCACLITMAAAQK